MPHVECRMENNQIEFALPKRVSITAHHDKRYSPKISFVRIFDDDVDGGGASASFRFCYQSV